MGNEPLAGNHTIEDDEVGNLKAFVDRVVS
jgi:hypothetical protein